MCLQQRFVLAERNVPVALPHPDFLKLNRPDYSLTQCFQQLEKLAPTAFRHWHRMLDVNASAYEGFPIDSCSVIGHPISDKFRLFLRPYLSGTVLDIGCGPQPVPQYLQNHPLELIAGVDPLMPQEPHPFVFAQGTAEFLPWADETFDTVVCSTSLDHVLLLDCAFAEISRVLKKNGTFVVWVSFLPGSKKYDPYSPDIRPVDAFHLFHFDREWFLSMLEERFCTLELFEVDASSHFGGFRPLR